MKKRKDSGRQAIVLLCVLLFVLVLLLGYFAFWPVAISGTVFDDRNGDRIRQPQEVGLAARVVRLVNAAGKEVKTKTKRDGGYRFDGLGVGKYTVVVVSDSPSADASTERKVTITRRREATGIDVGVPPEEPKDQPELRRNHPLWAAKNGGDEDTERAVGLALEWLAKHQCNDGGWLFDLARPECRNCRGKCSTSETPRFDRTAATALALLPFLGRGISHSNSNPVDARYQSTVAKGIAFLQDRVADDGKVDGVGEHWSMYSQGLAGIVLAELCEIVASDQANADADKPKLADNLNDEPIDEKALVDDAKRVLRFICRAQDREGGGWRYVPRESPGDTSVVGWQMMALHAGKKHVLKAPDTWKRAAKFLDSVQAGAGATYGYQTHSDPIPRRSAIGLLCRMYDDWPEKHPPLLDGVSRIAKVGPTPDLYFDYYATQVMFHIGGEQWKDWNQKMKQLLLDTQRKAEHGHEVGSWYEGVQSDPNLDTPGGRLYSTSLAAMILEVYHRHLRIYRPRD
jgi:hypothetical protein